MDWAKKFWDNSSVNENGKIDVSNLITHYFDIKDGDKGIKLLDKKVNHLGIIINYPNKKNNFKKWKD